MLKAPPTEVFSLSVEDLVRRKYNFLVPAVRSLMSEAVIVNEVAPDVDVEELADSVVVVPPEVVVDSR